MTDAPPPKRQYFLKVTLNYGAPVMINDRGRTNMSTLRSLEVDDPQLPNCQLVLHTTGQWIVVQSDLCRVFLPASDCVAYPMTDEEAERRYAPKPTVPAIAVPAPVVPMSKRVPTRVKNG